MTSVKKNDFKKDSLIENDEGQQIEFKQLDDRTTCKFDADLVSGNKLQADVLEIASKTPFFEKWEMPDEESGRKFGSFEPIGKNWVRVTIKNIETTPKTYLHTHIMREAMLDLFKKYSLKPKWTKYNRDTKRYEKVVE